MNLVRLVCSGVRRLVAALPFTRRSDSIGRAQWPTAPKQHCHHQQGTGCDAASIGLVTSVFWDGWLRTTAGWASLAYREPTQGLGVAS